MTAGAPVAVRAATAADAPAIAAIYGAVVRDTVISFEEVPPDAAEIARRMMACPRLPWLVADDDGRVAGYAYATRHRERAAYRWSVDFSIYLDPVYHRRGLGRLLYARLADEVRALGYVTAFAGIALPNPASVGLHEAVGFAPVGTYRAVGHKHGAWHDVGWWQLALCDAPPVPDEPREWAETP